MDIGMKERVIGAAVLVVLGIIIIPWVLEGPAPSRSVTRNVQLPAAETTATPAEIRMPLAEQPEPSASPATNPPSSLTSGQVSVSTPQATKPPAAAQAPAKAQPIARQAAASSTVGSNDEWMVQAGSYSSEHNAIRLQQTLEKHGYHVEVSRYRMGKRTYYRVRVGPYQDPAAARKVIPDINRIYGGKAKVVPNS